MLLKTMCNILPPYTLVPLHSLNRIIYLAHIVRDVHED
jgi:hypothetical protein